jgi:LL-diaminopimelate aminotransferase
LRFDNNYRLYPEEWGELLAARPRLVVLNYPHNPTGAGVDAAYWRSIVPRLSGDGTVLVNDAAYLEVALTQERPASLLAACDLRHDRVVEFHSLSKSFNMTGWRIGFAVGHADVIGALSRVKESLDSGVFGAIQAVAARALSPEGDAWRREVVGVYAPRRRLVATALEAAGCEVFPASATFYVWARVPGGGDSLAFATRALEETGVVVAPGVGFGAAGEGWFRISLTAPDPLVATAAERLANWLRRRGES